MTARAETPPASRDAPGPAAPKPERLRRRAEFLRAASALRQGTDAFLLQGRPRADGSDAIRVGFTCSRKVGNAVMRNRARRRLREIARAILPGLARPGWDYVLVGRPG
ncbi:MAG: ribonuclease P protein component, partial [Alphaproteobacteria bacterium]|nr:ribonuclease P protein component [Alphaproteobacteria bacterium]